MGEPGLLIPVRSRKNTMSSDLLSSIGSGEGGGDRIAASQQSHLPFQKDRREKRARRSKAILLTKWAFLRPFGKRRNFIADKITTGLDLFVLLFLSYVTGSCAN